MSYVQKIQALARELIGHITEFSEHEENFELSERYVVSNLRYHSYLDTNSHEVRKQLDGVIKKLQIHGFSSEAQKLKTQTDGFLNHSIFKQNNQSELQWNMMALLLRLSEHPTRPTYRLLTSSDNFKASTPLQEEEETIDWVELLRPSPLSSLSSDSDDSEPWLLTESGASEGSIEEHEETPEVHRGSQSSSSTFLEKSGVDGEDNVNDKDVKKETLDAARILDEQRHYPYWHDISYRKSTFSRGYSEDWIKYQLSLKGKQLKEYELLYEILFFLTVPGKGLFDFRDGAVIMKESVCLSSLTPACVRSVLETMAPSVTFLQKVKEFIHENISLKQCFTVKCYAEALHTILCNFENALFQIEKELLKQEEPYTLLMLLKDVDPWFKDFYFLRSLHQCIVDRITEAPSNSARADHLVNILNEARTNPIGETLFQAFIRPYLSLLECWVYTGELRDPKDEFLLVWNSEVKMTSEDWWHNVVHTRESGGSFEVFQPLILPVKKAARAWIMFKELLPDETISFVEEVADNEETEVVTKYEAVDVKSDKFYKVSMDLLFSKMFDENKFQKQIQLQKRPKKPLETAETRLIRLCKECDRISVELEKSIKEHLQLVQHVRILRAVYLMEAGDVMHTFYSYIFKEIQSERPDLNTTLLNVMLRNCLVQRFPELSSLFSVSVKGRVMKSSGFLDSISGIDVIYNLPENLSIFFFSFDKYQDIFHFLMQLKCALYLLSHLRFKDLTLMSSEYDNVNGEVISPHQKVRRLQLLRSWLLHFLGSVHAYVMNSVLHPASLRVEKTLESSTDLYEIQKAHKGFVESIWENCLLHDPAKPLMLCMKQVFKLAITVHKKWKSSTINYDSLTALEKEYVMQHHFLADALEVVQQHTNINQLEGLVANLKTSFPAEA